MGQSPLQASIRQRPYQGDYDRRMCLAAPLGLTCGDTTVLKTEGALAQSEGTQGPSWRPTPALLHTWQQPNRPRPKRGLASTIDPEAKAS